MTYGTRGIANELMHFCQSGKESFSQMLRKHYYERSEKFCPFRHGPKTDMACYVANPEIADLLVLLKKYILRFEYLSVDVYSLEALHERLEEIKDPFKNQDLKTFKSNLDEICVLVELNEGQVHKRVSLCVCEECSRLDEAVNAFESHCYYSAVIMAVSAVEARLHYLIRTKSRRIYERHFEDASLGQIVKLLDPNEYKDRKYSSIKRGLPANYKPLIEVLNIYRVFSAHPKTEKIDFKIAQSVLNLSFNFLLSEEARIKEKRLLQHH